MKSGRTQIVRDLLFLVAADLADEHDAVGLRIGEEQLEAFDEADAVHGIAADADGGRLAETFGR